MKVFLASALFGHGRKVEALATLLKTFNKPHASFTRKNCDGIKTSFQKIGRACDYLNLPVSKAACDDIVALVSTGTLPKSSEIQPLFVEVNKRIEIELGAHIYLCVPKEYADFYKSPLENWKDAIGAFPSSEHDIEEASKCLALRRNTACVFHLMRVMGAGVTALGKSLNEPTLDASQNLTWDNVLRRCARELEKDFKKMSLAWQSDKQFYATATTKLFAVKDAWRNPNAHELGNKYTDEETLDIYRTIRSFMRHLATKLKETP
jgi:hypothetical protein